MLGPEGRSAIVAVAVAALAVAAVLNVGLGNDRSWGGPTANLGSPAASPLPSRSASVGGDVEVAPAFLPSPGVVKIGTLPPADTFSVEVGLAPSDPNGLAALIAAQYAPGTSEYRHFLAPAELASRFGPSASVLATARSYFDRFGLSVRENPDHLLLTVTGPARELAPAFGTSFEEYTSATRTFVSHPTPASLPAIAPWSGVYGLGNVTPLVPSVGGQFAVSPTPAVEGPCVAVGASLTPCDLWQAYNMTALFSTGIDGSGRSIAVVDAYSSSENQSELASDLTAFAGLNGLDTGTVNFTYPDAGPADLNTSRNPSWNAEDALDLEWARAAAPGATILDTFSPNAGAGLYEAVDWLVGHQAADVISLSWGEPDVGVFNAFSTPCSVACNASTDGSYGILSPVLEFAAAEGIGVFAASGDCGASDGTSGLSTNYPASDPDVTGVGGTVLSVGVGGDYVAETAWSGNATGARPPGCTNQGGSGGGFAPFPRPTWQTGLPSGTTARGVPDVALNAGTPTEIVLGGSTVAILGTSLATPVWAGIEVDADEFAGTPLGFLDPTLYEVASGPDYLTDFHGILSGNNGYAAGPGWDPITGLGSPRLAALVPDLVHPVPLGPSDLAAFVYATPRFGKLPLTATFRVSASGGTGSYPLEGISFGDGNASFAPNGSATHTFVSPGVYAAEAYVADSGGAYAVSPPVAIVVGGGTALAVSLTASTVNPGRGAPVVLTAGATGGVAPYLYNFTFGDGTFLLGSSVASTTHAFGANGSFCAEVVVSDSAIPVDGGASARVAVGVGGAPVPDCGNDTVPLTMTPSPNSGVRDAPADFPELFSVAGGSTAASGLSPSLQFSSPGDPYAEACGCAIFREPGEYTVTGYANDSENAEASATTDVTVAPPLVANFTASPAYGPAPLTVTFRASASGGDGANASDTRWTIGPGTELTGNLVSTTYDVPGRYLAVAGLSDLGDGNASEAFLIDVGPPAGSVGAVGPALTATVAPAENVALGTAVNFTARLVSANGSSVPGVFAWHVGAMSGGYRPSLNWTYSDPLPAGTGNALNVTLNATALSSGVSGGAPPAGVGFVLSGFGAIEAGGFEPRTDGLVFSDAAGPETGTAPLGWKGTATATGPGGATVEWVFGDGSEQSGGAVQHAYAPGQYTVEVTATDGWGDVATDVHPVDVVGVLSLSASLSSTSGAAPLTVDFRAVAAGGVGPPYVYLWSFGDGTNSSAENGTHAFPSSGTFAISLRVSDTGHDSADRNWTVQVAPSFAAYLPALLLGAGAAAGVAMAVVLGRRRSPAPGA